jgi:hypothetical protein
MARFAHMLKGMFRTSLLIALACAVSQAAGAQPWAEAYKAGDYAKAASLLQPIVIDHQQSMGAFFDPEPSRALALLYAQGRGVPRDEVIACSLAQQYSGVMHMRPVSAVSAEDIQAYIESLAATVRFTRELCNGLTDRQKLAAAIGQGCFAFGLTEKTLTLGERTVWIDRVGPRLGESDDERVASNLWCPQLVARLEARTIEPPSDAAPGVKVRHFIELLSWDAGRMPDDATPRYILVWKMFELQGKTFQPVAMESFDSATTWPASPMPPAFDSRLHVEMIRSGHIRWRLDGTPPKRGWIMLPEGDSR